MKRKFSVNVIALLMAMSILTAVLSGCVAQDKAEIKEVLEEFQEACNYEVGGQPQINAFLKTINPKISEKVALAVGVINLFTDKDADEMFGDLAKLLISNDTIDGAEFFKSLKIDCQDIRVKKSKGSAEVFLSYNLSSVMISKEAVIDFIKTADNWYINGISFQ